MGENNGMGEEGRGGGNKKKRACAVMAVIKHAGGGRAKPRMCSKRLRLVCTEGQVAVAGQLVFLLLHATWETWETPRVDEHRAV